MREYISFDSHKRYTLAERESVAGGRPVQTRIEHAPGAIRRFLQDGEPGAAVAVEAIGSWYWIIDEIEQAGLRPLLVHPRKAKLMMGLINKTDRLDVHGLNRLQRNRSLPTVWIPPGELRDLREVTRSRITLVRQRTRVKNHISAALAKYGRQVTQFSDPFGKKARVELEQRLAQLPESTAWVVRMWLDLLDFLNRQVGELERRLQRLVQTTPEMQLLTSIPGVGVILATTIALEIGDIGRFGGPEKLAGYCGVTPRVHASGGKVRYGGLRSDVNRYLKWAFSEAANSIAVNHKRRPDCSVSRLYHRLRARKGHAKAVGAVARRLAEAAYIVLKKREVYRDPTIHKNQTEAAAQRGAAAQLASIERGPRQASAPAPTRPLGRRPKPRQGPRPWTPASFPSGGEGRRASTSRRRLTKRRAADPVRNRDTNETEVSARRLS